MNSFKEECAKIMHHVMTTIITEWISSKIPRKIVYGNEDEFGLDIINVYIKELKELYP